MVFLPSWELGLCERRPMPEQEPPQDLGWQVNGLTKKFHYFIAKGREIMQVAICGKWGIFPESHMEPDLNPPSDESCKECGRRWVRTYGTRDTGDGGDT